MRISKMIGPYPEIGHGNLVTHRDAKVFFFLETIGNRNNLEDAL